MLVFQCWSFLPSKQNGEKMTEKWTREKFLRWVQQMARYSSDGKHYEQLKEYDPTLAAIYRESCMADKKLTDYCRTKLESK